MRPGWLVLTLAACADRSPQTQAVGAPVVVPAAPAPSTTAPAAELVDPPYPLCPAAGWATAAVLVGPWSTRWAGHRVRTEIWEKGLRHDYQADGTVRSIHITRHPPPRAERNALYGGWIGTLPRPEERKEMLGTWRLDESGVRELRWADDTTTRVTRERVWVEIPRPYRPYAALALRPLERGPDDAWRGEVFYSETDNRGERGHESRIELRFDPPLGTVAATPCNVEVRRALRVWGDGKPATWNGLDRGPCVVTDQRVELGPFEETPDTRPNHDPRLRAAYDAFNERSLDRVAADVLLLRQNSWEPTRRGRDTDPPLLWHDVIAVGRCTPAPK